MNLESLAIESQEEIKMQPFAEFTPEQTHEVTSLAFETLGLIGGGSSVVLL